MFSRKRSGKQPEPKCIPQVGEMLQESDPRLSGCRPRGLKALSVSPRPCVPPLVPLSCLWSLRLGVSTAIKETSPRLHFCQLRHSLGCLMLLVTGQGQRVGRASLERKPAFGHPGRSGGAKEPMSVGLHLQAPKGARITRLPKV